MPVEQVASYVESDVKQELEERAAREGRSLSNYVAKILTDHINNNGKDG